jgi:NAD(P)H dehydrogenase (quinone)
VQDLQDIHILRNAGFELLEHVHFDNVVPRLSVAIVAQHMARVRWCVRQHFAAS